MFSLLNLHSGILKGKSYLIPLQFLFWALAFMTELLMNLVKKSK